MSDDERPPEMTPWGPKQVEWEDMAGFWWVSTPRHGSSLILQRTYRSATSLAAADVECRQLQ